MEKKFWITDIAPTVISNDVHLARNEKVVSAGVISDSLG